MARAIPYEISVASAADLPDVLVLLRRCELLENGVAEAIANFFVARSSTLLGCAGLEMYGSSGLLRSVAVDSAARGNGLGSELIESVVTAARGRGLSELFLLTTTAPRFFEQLGYRAVQRSTVPLGIAESWEFRVGCPQSAVAMRLELAKSRVE